MQLINMFHIAKVLKLIKPDNKNIVSSDRVTVAMIRTWDENTLIMAVDDIIVDKVKEGDYVLVDYRIRENHPSPRHIITKILKDSLGKEIWELAVAHLEEAKKRAGMQTAQGAVAKPPQYR